MKIELLGFPGCPNTPAMRESLHAALLLLSPRATFTEIDQEALLADDPRRGWPAPTVLVDGADLFGMAAPAARSMGCRVYAGGVPDPDAITNRLLALTAAGRSRASAP